MSSTRDIFEQIRRGPLAWMAQNHVAANVLMLVLIIGGFVTFSSAIRQEVFPEVELDRVNVEVAYPGASPAEVEQGVILAIEEQVRGIDGVDEVRSTAREGIGIVYVDLLLGTDNDRALSDVKSAVDRITSFPQDAERPVVSLITNRTQVLSLVLYGDIDEATLRSVAEDMRRGLLEHGERMDQDLAEKAQSPDLGFLERVGLQLKLMGRSIFGGPSISYVELGGARPLEVSIEVPQAKLREHNVTLTQIADRVRSASVELPGGGIKTESGEVLLRTAERRDRGHEFDNIVLKSYADGTMVRVADIAEVKDGFKDVDRKATFNGKRAMMVKVFRVGEETPIKVSEAVYEYIERVKPTLPPNLEITTWADMSEMYEGRLELLLRNARIGLLLVLLILGLFLEGRLAFWVTLGIPISFAGSLLFFPAADISINMITLFGFIVTLGMVVDDAIVVGEAIYKERSQGTGLAEAAIHGVREVARPVTFSIATTCVAFTPMLFVPGVMGKFFRVLPIVVISVLIISLVESLFVLPAHLSHRMPGWLQVILSPYLLVMKFLERFKTSERLEHFVDNRYVPQLKWALERRYLTTAIALAIFIVSLGVGIFRVPFAFMPRIEGDVITAQLKMPVGTPAAQTDAINNRIANTGRDLANTPENGSNIIRGMYQELGAASSIDPDVDGTGAGEGGHLATVMLYLVDASKRNITTGELVSQWRETLGEIPGAESLTFSYSVGTPPGEPINVELIHNNVETLEAAAERLASEIKAYSGLRDIKSGVAVGKEQLDFHLTRAGGSRGLTEAELARQVRAAFFGSEAVRQQRGRDEVRVYVRLPLEERKSLYDVEQLLIRTPDGGEIPLAQAARVERGRAYTVIRRSDGRRNISVTADIDVASANANQIMEQIKAKELRQLLADIPGLDYSLGGEQERQADSMMALALGFVVAIIVIFAILAVVFRSYSQPLLIMSAIPFGLVGAIWGHIVMGYDLSIMSTMGLVALSGVVVNDSLILIDAVNRYRDQGMDLVEAVVAGGRRRFRPILLTSLTTFFGLAPMIIETSVQARFLIPMAISLGFGVLFATFIMLLFVPANYLILEDVRSAFGRLAARMSERTKSMRPPPIPDPAEEDPALTQSSDQNTQALN